MSRDRFRLVAALLLAAAFLPGRAFAGEPAPAQETQETYTVRGTTIQWNHAGRTGVAVQPQLKSELRALINARLNGAPAPATRPAAVEKRADGTVVARVPAEKFSVIVFQLDPTKGLLGENGQTRLDHGLHTCNEADRLAPSTRLISSEAPLY